MKLLHIFLRCIPIPRIGRPPRTPTTFKDKLLKNRTNASSRVTWLGHVLTNASDLLHKDIYGIDDKDRIYRDRNNRFDGYGRDDR